MLTCLIICKRHWPNYDRNRRESVVIYGDKFLSLEIALQPRQGPKAAEEDTAPDAEISQGASIRNGMTRRHWILISLVVLAIIIVVIGGHILR